MIFEKFMVTWMPRLLFDQLSLSRGRKRAVRFPMVSGTKSQRFTRTAGLPFPVFNALCIQAEKISLS